MCRPNTTRMPLEQVIAAQLGTLFPGMDVEECVAFRVTRNADLTLEEEEADDLLAAVEMAMTDEAAVIRVLTSMPGYVDAFAAAFPTVLARLRSGVGVDAPGFLLVPADDGRLLGAVVRIAEIIHRNPDRDRRTGACDFTLDRPRQSDPARHLYGDCQNSVRQAQQGEDLEGCEPRASGGEDPRPRPAAARCPGR